MFTKLILNDGEVATELPAGRVVLDFVRSEQGLKGTKEGCREGDCGACSVLLGEMLDGSVHYRVTASCLLPVGALHGCHLVTIEGLTGDGLSVVQQAMVAEGATQCGFCTPGIIMALTGFMLNSFDLSVEDAITAMEGNICRCTGYSAIRRAALRLVESMPELPPPGQLRIQTMVAAGILPKFFMGVEERLSGIEAGPVVEGGIAVGGGTDLFVQRPEALTDASLHFCGANRMGSSIWREQDRIVIAASATAEDLMNAPLLVDMFACWRAGLALMASSMIRSRATVAGNIVNASPIGDISIMLLALGAELTLESNENLRRVALQEFYHGYKQLDLQDGEVVRSVEVPVPPQDTHYSFEKVSRREHLDIASVNSALVINLQSGKIDLLRISAGGVGPVPVLLTKTSEHLLGHKLTEALVNEAVSMAQAEVAPISDVRGSAEYKRLLLGRLIRAHFVKLFPELE
jgi:xanthine dehydrogenase small subunit